MPTKEAQCIPEGEASELFERGPTQQERLLAGIGEPDDGFGLVALAAHREDDSFAKFAVPHPVTGLEPKGMGARWLGLPGFQCIVDNSFTMLEVGSTRRTIVVIGIVGRHTGTSLGRPPATG